MTLSAVETNLVEGLFLLEEHILNKEKSLIYREEIVYQQFANVARFWNQGNHDDDYDDDDNDDVDDSNITGQLNTVPIYLRRNLRAQKSITKLA
jgi:hypothetical protein